MSTSSSSWWAKRLGQPAQQPAPGYGAPPAYGAPPSYPRTPQGYQQPPPMPQPNQHVQVTKDNVVELAGMWQGGQGTKTETQTCPNCGSGDYFSRANVSGSKKITSSGMVAHAAPHCFRCGHNGMYTQAGGQ